MMTKEKFLQELKQRSLRQKVVVGVLLLIQLYRSFYGTNHQSFGMGFLTGLLIVFACSQIFLNRKLKAVRENPTEFERFYIEETDEYQVFKRNKISELTFGLSVDVLLGATVIASFYNEVIMWTLMSVVFGIFLLQIVVHGYVNRKY